ncbi:MAG: hypothetical protein WEA82_06570 [Idiomarina sp.]
MGIKRFVSEYSKKNTPSNISQIYWIYQQLIDAKKIPKPTSPPTRAERKDAITYWLDKKYEAGGESAVNEQHWYATQLRNYHASALKDSDIAWITNLRSHEAYLLWLTLLRSAVPVHPNEASMITSDIYLYYDREMEESFCPQGVSNNAYLALGLSTKPRTIKELHGYIVDFLIGWSVDSDTKRDYLLKLKAFLDQSPPELWFNFAKNETEVRLDWLWNYMRTTAKLPGLVSDSLTDFRWERLYAEFRMLDKSDEVLIKIHKSAQKAFANSVTAKSNGRKARINLTIDKEAKEILEQIAGGPRKQSQLVQELIYREAKKISETP